MPLILKASIYITFYPFLNPFILKKITYDIVLIHVVALFGLEVSLTLIENGTLAFLFLILFRITCYNLSCVFCLHQKCIAPCRQPTKCVLPQCSQGVAFTRNLRVLDFLSKLEMGVFLYK